MSSGIHGFFFRGKLWSLHMSACVHSLV